MNRRFDAIVIGAGQAGPPMVGRIATTGAQGQGCRRVAVVARG
jgi:pyruvate/2-oxoglutarate dehydrogenase complex dihydrolipoamide dehydrogenase (E3) component